MLLALTAAVFGLATVVARVGMPPLASLCLLQGLTPLMGATQAFQVAALAPLGYNAAQYKAPVIGIATRLIQESFACICALALAA